MYWFYILKETYGYSTNNIEQDVIIANSRNEAKSYVTELYGELPFRKPKNVLDGTRYIYLTESNEYWYNRLHAKVTYTCSWCGKETSVIGERNVIRNWKGEYCTTECKEALVEDANKHWINKDDHTGLGHRQRKNLVGYVYKITNKNTMKCYVGQTINAPLFRWWEHLKTDHKFEQADITELVFEVLEIVEYDSNIDTVYKGEKDKLNKREAHYIALYDCVEEGYNSVQPKEFEHDLFTINKG